MIDLTMWLFLANGALALMHLAIWLVELIWLWPFGGPPTLPPSG